MMETTNESKHVLNFITYCIDYMDKNECTIDKDVLLILSKYFFKSSEQFAKNGAVFVKELENGDKVHEFTQIVFDKKTGLAKGVRTVDEKIEKLSKKEVVLCEANGWYFLKTSCASDVNVKECKFCV
jgi:hypothetical protein